MSASGTSPRRRSNAGELARIAVFGLPVAALIAAEDRAARWLPLRFPRSPAAFDRDPRRLFDLLTIPSRGLLAPVADRSTTRLVGQTRGGTLVNEPDKNRMTGVFALTLDEQGRERTVDVVTKFQSGRGMPLYIQTIRAVVEYRFAREIAFYRRLAHVVPVNVPRPLFADAVTVLNRVCLVLEFVEGQTPADWRGCPLPAVQTLLASAARLNGRYLNDLQAPAVAWIPARAGLDYADFVTSFIAKQPLWFRGIWTALQRYFAAAPVTLVHGDCRPGNMRFRGVDPHNTDDGDDVVSAWAPRPEGASVVMADWEAINVAPLMWDFTYCTAIGLRVADRRAWLPQLLEGFLDDLQANGVDRRYLDVDRAMLDTQLLAIVLAYVSIVVLDHGLWSGQGNTQADAAAWGRRVMEAGADHDSAAIAAALEVPAGDVARLQSYFLGRLRA